MIVLVLSAILDIPLLALDHIKRVIQPSYLNCYEIISREGLVSKQLSPTFGFDVEFLNCLQ